MHGNNKRTYTRTCQESMTNMLKQMNPFLLLLWIATFSIMGVLVLLEAEMSAVVSFCRILVPPLLIAIICHYEWISYPKRFLTRASVIRRVLILPFLTCSMNWLVQYSLTNYRSHHRPMMIPLSIIIIYFCIVITHWPSKNAKKGQRGL